MLSEIIVTELEKYLLPIVENQVTTLLPTLMSDLEARVMTAIKDLENKLTPVAPAAPVQNPPAAS